MQKIGKIKMVNLLKRLTLLIIKYQEIFKLMIKSLSISNFVLIDDLTIKFNDGFSVITGETGSGKSILFNALNLLLGDRADYSLIGYNADKALLKVYFK